MSRRNIGQAGKILADSAYQGIMKIDPQAQTPRKSSKLKPLTAEEKPVTMRYLRRESRLRIFLTSIVD
ncbi:hypothetical protein HMPREF1112_0907 [Streptococcus pseudopneumoniae SK674]|nr:hypothetical protein HMPREF1112_0907 [Streptococcus pseudopneumoniae SK674]